MWGIGVLELARETEVESLDEVAQLLSEWFVSVLERVVRWLSRPKIVSDHVMAGCIRSWTLLMRSERQTELLTTKAGGSALFKREPSAKAPFKT
jgi:hypothetical protein